jgi:hypothetical protein
MHGKANRKSICRKKKKKKSESVEMKNYFAYVWQQKTSKIQ